MDSNYLSCNSGIQSDSDNVGKTCNLSTSCPCGSKFDIHHSMICKKGSFIHIGHNDLQDLTANMMSELCKDTKIIWRRTARYEGTRILQIDHGTIKFLMFLINGSMGTECQKFYSHFAHMLSEKRDHPQSISRNWIRTKVCFGLVTSSMLCLRGSRTVCRKTAEFEIDVDVAKISTR